MSAAVGIMAIKFDKTDMVKRIYFTYGHTTDSMVRLALYPQSRSTILTSKLKQFFI